MDIIGDKIGRVHTGKQDLGKLQTRKMKGLKKRGAEDDAETLAGDDEEAAPKKSRKE